MDFRDDNERAGAIRVNVLDDKKIVIWGTGHIARNFFYEKCYQYDVQYFIDNYEPRYRIKDFEIHKPEEVDLKKYRIIIALNDWQNVADQLDRQGLTFYKNYLPFFLSDKNEIPIIEILTRIKNSKDKEDAILAYQRGRKVALINGNCQTSRIKMYLQQNQEFDQEFVFLDIPALYTLSHDETDLLMRNKDVLKKVRLFISQNVSLNNAFDYRFSNEYLIELMNEDVQYIRIPNLFFDIYFPQGGKEQDPRKELFLRNLFPYNDAVIDELVSKEGFDGGGYTADEIVEIIKMENFFPDYFLKWIIQYRLKQLRDREESCDIKMMDYIEQKYLKEQLFYSRNHPTNKVLKEVSTRILRFMNIQQYLKIDHEDTIPELSINQELIYPSIYHNLRTEFVKEWYSDTISECIYILDEEIKKYLYCCHNRK